MAWPKPAPELSEEDARLNDDWQRHWYEINKDKFSAVVEFNHRFVIEASGGEFESTLEVGAGLGEHIQRAGLKANQLAHYQVVEVRPNMAEVLHQAFPQIKILIQDCQDPMPLEAGSLDRIIAIHVLEHLRRLPEFLNQVELLLKPGTGRFLVVLPCEGGLGYTLGRQVTSKRLFEARYHKPYGPFIRAEHPNQAVEVLRELRGRFRVAQTEWWPLRVPSVNLNLCVGLSLAKK